MDSIINQGRELSNNSQNSISSKSPRFISILERLPKGIGKEYMLGKVTTSHDDISHLIYNALCSLPLSESEIQSEYKDFLFYQFNKQATKTFDKPVKDIVIPIPMEKSLLRNMRNAEEDYARQALRKAITQMCKCSSPSATQALGLLLGNLMLESGIINSNDQISFLRSSLGGLIALENIWFVESKTQFQNSTRVGVRRFILDPLSICIFITHFEKIQPLISGLSSDKELLSLIKMAFNALTNAAECEQFSISQYRRGAALEALHRVPGFIYQRLLGKSESYDLPLHALARCMNVYSPPPAPDTVTQDQDDEDEDEDEDDEEPDTLATESGASNGKARVVKANIITTRQFEEFMVWVNTHPSISSPERQQLGILLNLSFYCGFRRGEAKGLRLKDIHPETPVIGHLRPYAGHTLKTTSATRKVLLEWIPTPLCLAIAEQARANRYSEQTLIEGYSGADFIASLYEKANTLIQRFFGDPSLTVHSLRHSYTSLNLIKVLAGPLRMYELSGLSSLVDDLLPEASSFTLSLLGHLNPSAKLLWSISKSIGHINPSTTLRSYTHVLDLLAFYSYAYSRPQGYYTRICEVSGITNRQLHKHLNNPITGYDHFRYDDEISFSGKIPYPLLKQLEQRYPNTVTRLTGSFSDNNLYTCDDWTKLTALFSSAKTFSISSVCSDISDTETIDFIRNFSPTDNDLKVLLTLLKRIPPECISLSLLREICRHYDRRHGFLAMRKGFPTQELAKFLRKQGLNGDDFVLRAYGTSVLVKKTIGLTSSFTALSRLKVNGQLSYKPKHLQRVPHAAIHWYFRAILLKKSAASMCST